MLYFTLVLPYRVKSMCFSLVCYFGVTVYINICGIAVGRRHWRPPSAINKCQQLCLPQSSVFLLDRSTTFGLMLTLSQKYAIIYYLFYEVTVTSIIKAAWKTYIFWCFLFYLTPCAPAGFFPGGGHFFPEKKLTTLLVVTLKTQVLTVNANAPNTSTTFPEGGGASALKTRV